MRIAAIVVTYNRKELLAKALFCIDRQFDPVDHLFIVDNASSDQTPQLLESLGYTQRDDTTVIHLPVNIGGAGGFSSGMKAAIQAGYDYLWLMDDDTMPSPEALLELKRTLRLGEGGGRVGFVCSDVRWKDGSAHLMNLPEVSTYDTSGTPFNHQKGMISISSCSFVSVLVSSTATIEVGLPYKEFFIWGDDQEFTRRIVSAGFSGYFSPMSQVLHATAENYRVDPCSEQAGPDWKYVFGTRNSLFIARRDRGIIIYGLLLFKAILKTGKILFKNRINGKAVARSTLIGALRSLRFSPKIDHP